MKLIEKNTGRTVEIKMHIVDDDRALKSMDISSDFFGGDTVEVTDIEYCIGQVADWVIGRNDYAIGGDMGYRMANIDGTIFSNYTL